MATISRIKMSIVGTDSNGKEKHVQINITDPQACAELGAGGDGEWLADTTSLAEDLCDHNADGALIEMTTANAQEILGGTPLKVDAPVIEVTEKQVQFLQSRGYAVSTIAQAKVFIENMSPENRAGFFAEADKWTPPTPVATRSADAGTGDGTQAAQAEGQDAPADQTTAAAVDQPDVASAD